MTRLCAPSTPDGSIKEQSSASVDISLSQAATHARHCTNKPHALAMSNGTPKSHRDSKEAGPQDHYYGSLQALCLQALRLISRQVEAHPRHDRVHMRCTWSLFPKVFPGNCPSIPTHIAAYKIRSDFVLFSVIEETVHGNYVLSQAVALYFKSSRLSQGQQAREGLCRTHITSLPCSCTIYWCGRKEEEDEESDVLNLTW